MNEALATQVTVMAEMLPYIGAAIAVTVVTVIIGLYVAKRRGEDDGEE